MNSKTLLKDIPYTCLQGDLEAEVSGICHDNRKLKAGDAFICITGARFDTHDMAQAIADAGAALLVTERDIPPLSGNVAVVRVEDTRKVSPLLSAAFYGHPADKMTTVGITGTKGKTTSAHMMADILRAAGYVTGTIGSTGAVLPDVPEVLSVHGAERFSADPCEETPGYRVYKLANTTPDALELQMYLAMMAAAGCTHAVVEVSSQATKMHRTDGITFDYGIFTNIEHGDHVGPGEHKDFAEYLRCKAAVINQSRTAFVNADNPYLSDFLENVTLPKERIFTFGQNADADYHAGDLRHHYDEKTRQPGISFSMDGLCRQEVSVNLPGYFNMYNALAVCAVAHRMGIDSAAVHTALSHLKIRGRLDIVFDNGHLRVCVDSAHSGYSTRNHLQSLREYHPKRLVCVFGAGGNRDRDRRFGMGEASGALADWSIVTAEHNRFESFETISADIVTGIHRAEAMLGHSVDYTVIPKRKDAIRYAMEHAQEGDIITILGLGSDTFQHENGVDVPHSDTDFVRQVAHELGIDKT